MSYDDILISSDNFIALLIKLLQIRFGNMSFSSNYLTSVWSINMEELSAFIKESKTDFKYSALLKCFNFVEGQTFSYSVELITAFNRALAKKMLTTNSGSIYYISRVYNNDNIFYMAQELVPLMNDFIEDFYFYLSDPQSYLRVVKSNASMADEQIDFERNVFYLQRSLRVREGIVQPEFFQDNS